MAFLGILLGAYWFKAWVIDDMITTHRMRQRAANYKHPAMQPAVIRSPEFYRSLYYK